MKENVLADKSFEFAVAIISLCRELADVKKEYVLSEQLLKCGTRIGANVEEAIGGNSRADFFANITIAYKEARETLYWLRLLEASDLIKESVFIEHEDKCLELCRILSSIQKPAKTNS